MPKPTNYNVTYHGHYFDDRVEGHLYIEKEGACTITLTGAASMTQTELNEWGRRIAHILSNRQRGTR
jgi:hypothetical protein